MDLILWRHAEAEEGSLTLGDDKRRLTPRGDRQARDMARWLETRLPKDCRVLVSPAQRTQQTAHRLQRTYEIAPEVGTAACAADLLAAAGWPDGGRSVLIVGHQPTIGRLAARVLCGSEQDWAVKKGAVVWLGVRTRDGVTETVLKAVMQPGFL